MSVSWHTVSCTAGPGQAWHRRYGERPATAPPRKLTVECAEQVDASGQARQNRRAAKKTSAHAAARRRWTNRLHTTQQCAKSKRRTNTRPIAALKYGAMASQLKTEQAQAARAKRKAQRELAQQSRAMKRETAPTPGKPKNTTVLKTNFGVALVSSSLNSPLPFPHLLGNVRLLIMKFNRK